MTAARTRVRRDCQHPGRPHRHGTFAAYKYDECGCDPCAAEAARRHAAAEKRRILYGPACVDPTGTRRRIRALHAAGYSFHDIAAAIGVASNRSVESIFRWPTCRRDVAARTAAAYHRLAGTPGPSKRARTWALNRGWSGPDDWYGVDIDDPGAIPGPPPIPDDYVDEVAVELAVAGKAHWSSLSKAEKRETFRRMVAAGELTRVVEERLGLSGSTYARWRREDFPDPEEQQDEAADQDHTEHEDRQEQAA